MKVWILASPGPFLGNCMAKRKLAALRSTKKTATSGRSSKSDQKSQRDTNVARVPQFNVEEARDRLKRTGLRSTAARIAVLQKLSRSVVPLSHNEVVDELGEFGFDQSTIYRVLTELSESGVIARLDLGDSIRRFELVSEEADGAPEHPHFMCVDCGKVSCLSGYQFEIKPEKSSARRQLDIVQVLVKGHCVECQ